MATKVGDICAPIGKYLKDGEEKTRWGRCGVLLQTDKGYRIKLDMIPAGVGEDGLWLSVFEDDQGQGSGSGGQRPQKASQGLDPDSDLPF